MSRRRTPQNDLPFQYARLVIRLSHVLGGREALASELGVSKKTLDLRLRTRFVRREHVLAVEHLAQRLEGRPG